MVLVVFAAIPFWYLDHSRSTQTVRGVLLDVQARSLVFADQVTVRDSEGRLWTFDVAPEVSTNEDEPQSASHLRQHMAMAEPVIVRYRISSGRAEAVRIFDAEERAIPSRFLETAGDSREDLGLRSDRDTGGAGQ
jgi:hypothetical protein